METQNYDALEPHFNSSDTPKLRGLVSENSAIWYAAYVLYILHHKIRYGVSGFWHDPVGIEKALSSAEEIKVLASDVYYRFDIVHKIAR
jgi:hypothetical protein